MLIKRNLFEKLKAHLSREEISLITGPRQAGKTTVMLMLKKYLDDAGKHTLFLSMDFERDRVFFDSQDQLIRKIELELRKTKGFVFIDEIQRKENAGIFLKGIYDMKLPYKLIVTGSGSLELKEKIHESLAGRKIVFEMDTISFEEFINYKTRHKYEKQLKNYFEIETIYTESMLEEYLKYGGYPSVVLEKTHTEKIVKLDEILKSYIEKDIVYLLKVEKSEAFSSLLKILAGQIGKMVNYNELASTLGLSVQTVKHYLWYAEKTFILRKITPYFKNIRKEISKSPVYYFTDFGLRNYLLNILENPLQSESSGFLFQNAVFNILYEKLIHTSSGIHFWRTTEKAEVDFVIEYGQKIIPVEVKYKTYQKPIIERSLISFIKKYKPEIAFIVNKNLRITENVDSTRIVFITLPDLLETELTP